MSQLDPVLANVIGYILLFLPLGFIAAWLAREQAITRTLADYGTLTKALIVYRKKPTLRFPGHIGYEYSALNKHNELQAFQRKQSVSRAAYQSTEDWPEVTIAYLPGHPHISRLADDDNDPTLRQYQCLQVGCLMLFYPLLILVWVVTYYVTLAIYYRSEAARRKHQS